MYFLDEIPSGFSPIREIEHQFDLVLGLAISNILTYKSNHEETKKFQRQVKELMSNEYIWESMSSCVVLILLLPKKDDTRRICVDCKAINNITVKYRYLISILNDMLNELYGSCLFSKINLKSGHH